MRPEDLILVSVDDHVVEPPDMFAQHIPAAYRDRAPKVVKKRDGSDVWVFEGKQVPNIGLNAVVGRPPEEYGMEPTAFEQMRAGCYDLGARIGDMNANGVLGSICFPSFPNLCGQLFQKAEDKDLALVCLKAYNDWHVDEWCAGAPGRFIPLGLLPIWDPLLMAEEVRRLARKGCHAVSFSEQPNKLKLPSLHSDHWDPFWQACEDEGTIVCMHIGSGEEMTFTSLDAPIDTMITLLPMKILNCAADLVWSTILRRYPTLKFALSEGGVGWVPTFLERIDYVYQHHSAWTHQDFGGRKPSEVFLERVVLCFIDDATGIRNRDAVNIANVTWECDYPHSDTTWPEAPEVLMPSLEGVPDDVVNQITHENAMKHFRYDPFSVRPREQCTVGALRAEAADVDVTPQSQAGLRPTDESDRDPVTCGQVFKQLTESIRTPID